MPTPVKPFIQYENHLKYRLFYTVYNFHFESKQKNVEIIIFICFIEIEK